jgi:RNA-directed DNA polymerase
MPDRLQGLLEPYARTTCTYGSEGAGAQQCAPATRLISPLLLNVALHGLEHAAGVRYITAGRRAGDTKPGSPVVIRYADDRVPRTRLEVAM